MYVIKNKKTYVYSAFSNCSYTPHLNNAVRFRLKADAKMRCIGNDTVQKVKKVNKNWVEV